MPLSRLAYSIVAMFLLRTARRPPALALITAFAAALTACLPGAEPAHLSTERPSGVPASAQPAVVERVVDGDTVRVRAVTAGPLAVGRSESVRLLEVDTPETDPDRGGVECGGPEATAFAEDLLAPGSTVWLLPDVEDRDDYGRALRYAWTSDGVLYNDAVVREGHAEVFVVEPNVLLAERLRAVEAEARAAGRGIWGSCRR